MNIAIFLIFITHFAYAVSVLECQDMAFFKDHQTDCKEAVQNNASGIKDQVNNAYNNTGTTTGNGAITPTSSTGGGSGTTVTNGSGTTNGSGSTNTNGTTSGGGTVTTNTNGTTNTSGGGGTASIPISMETKFINQKIDSFAPPQSRSNSALKIQTRIACKTFEFGINSATSLDVIPTYSNPVYDENEFLLSHTTIEPANTTPIAVVKGGKATNVPHDTIVQLRCRGVSYTEYDGKIVKEYPARCNNGYFYPCIPSNKNYVTGGTSLTNTDSDPTLESFYSKYTGNQKACLTSRKDSMVLCKSACDVTRFVDSTLYTVNETIYDVKDWIGVDTANKDMFVVYKQVLPKKGITVACSNGAFLSTSVTGKNTNFTVDCEDTGYVKFINETSGICTTELACVTPENIIGEREWGVYKDGTFLVAGKDFNFIPSRAYIMVKCGQASRNDERSIICLNGMYKPTASRACINDNITLTEEEEEAIRKEEAAEYKRLAKLVQNT